MNNHEGIATQYNIKDDINFIDKFLLPHTVALSAAEKHVHIPYENLPSVAQHDRNRPRIVHSTYP